MSQPYQSNSCGTTEAREPGALPGDLWGYNTTKARQLSMAGDHPSKTRWEAENVIKVGLKVNRNQDPELFELLAKAENKAGVIRELLRLGLTTLQQQTTSK